MDISTQELGERVSLLACQDFERLEATLGCQIGSPESWKSGYLAGYRQGMLDWVPDQDNLGAKVKAQIDEENPLNDHSGIKAAATALGCLIVVNAVFFVLNFIFWCVGH